MNEILKYLRKNAIFVNYDPLRNKLMFNITQIRTTNSCFSMDADDVISIGSEELIRRLEETKKCHEDL